MLLVAPMVALQRELRAAQGRLQEGLFLERAAAVASFLKGPRAHARNSA
jgi:hypothetical protein